MSVEYKKITDEFNQRFTLHWQSATKILETEHPQLTQGSRLRPLICLWGFLISKHSPTNYDIDRIANVAVSIELLHKATILIDDWIDNDNERHGFNAYHYDHSPEEAIILSLNMISLSLKRLKNCTNDKIIMPQHYTLCLDTLIETIYLMSKGALEELRLKDNLIFEKSKISEIIQYETSEIIGNSLLIGYYVGLEQHTPSDQIVNEIKDIGDKFGHVFQTFNDLEAFVSPAQLKQHKGAINMDFFLNRKNIVVASLYEVANNKDRNILKNCTASQLQDMLTKYRITEFVYEQSNMLYDYLVKKVKLMANIKVSQEWICGFIEFFGEAKKYAESRLEMY